MIGLEFIEEILKLTLYSAYIADEEQPISLLLCANAEAGKSEQVKKSVQLDHVLIYSDVTAYGILQNYGDAIMKRNIRHILIPDLITPMSKRWETASSFISFLNMLIAEGIIEIRTYAFSKKFQQPVKCGMIACITPSELHDKRHKWLGMGFMSRVLPVSWDYTDKQQLEILKYIAMRNYQLEKLWSFKFPIDDIKVKLPYDLAMRMIDISLNYCKDSARDSQKLYGFRYQKHLQRLMIASAIADGRDIVNQDDFDKTVQLSSFLNLKFNKIGP